MVVQLAPTPAQPKTSQPSAAQSELQKLREYCLRLNQALEAERAKSSKLRQYIARLNSARAQPEPAPQTLDTALQSLVNDQTRLLEQLYAENQQQHAERQKQRSALADMEHKIQQLQTANDKLKARNIDLRRQLKPAHKPETPPVMQIVATEPRPAAKVGEKAPSAKQAAPITEEQSRLVRFSLIKKPN
jgi:hypothetical protein